MKVKTYRAPVLIKSLCFIVWKFGAADAFSGLIECILRRDGAWVG